LPLLSVIIPMRNAEPFVRAAVESVLTQEQVELEVIVVDDGSLDRSVQIVREIDDPRIRIIPGPRQGISAAFNAGLAAAKGEFLARCDADDLYPPNRLGWQIEFLQSHPEFGAVCGFYSQVTARGRLSADQNADQVAEEVTEELSRGIGRSHVCAYVYRTAIIRQIGGCRTYFVTAEDADLQYRLGETTRVWYEPRPTYLYRLHDASITHVQHAGERAFFELMARKFQDQRLRTGRDDLQLGQAPKPPEIDQHFITSSRNQIQSILLGKAWDAHDAGRKVAAVLLGLRAAMIKPLRWGAWKSVAALAVKPAGALIVTPPSTAATPAGAVAAARGASAERA
jgi:glycosyltransferase involved in cell wall biosynthesis